MGAFTTGCRILLAMPPLGAAQVRQLRQRLLAWYDAHRRDLPWRESADPYRVWVSEIMLQQTRVAAVLAHYARFMRRFPTVKALAGAREQSVLALWSGLGYYHRARRMQQAAKRIVRERGGQFPSRFEDWLELPGIGRYTAAAIASIAFGEPVAVVDGNVERVLARVEGVAMKSGSAWERAQALLDPQRPGDFNQAMMELGATICTPRSPQCLLCPVSTFCATRGEQPSTRQAPRKRKQLCYALVEKNGAVLLVQRSAEARLMAGMWELPQLAEAPVGAEPMARLRHSITDTDYEVLLFRLPELTADNAYWFTPQRWKRLALTGLVGKILTKLRQMRG
jgi:A/G-specific adenine glycosylase